MATTDFDAVIVGSGAGGGALAAALCDAGFRTLVLEKGPHYTEADFFHDELTVCRRPFFVPDLREEPNMLARDGEPARPTSDGWISCCVGGGTEHMSGFFFRLHREDLRVRTRWGEVAGASVADWPIDWEELEPFYDQAEHAIGMSGDAGKNPFEPRRRAYPLAPIVAHPASALLDATCARLGYHPFPTPRAILSAPYQGRPACHYCGFCGSYGCEAGAKSTSRVSFLAAAQATGKLTLTPRAMATRVTTDARGRARGVVWQDERGAQHLARGRVIVLAASAIQTARLLLLSELANASGLVGRNLMFSTLSAGWGRFALPSPHFAGSGRELPFIDRALQDFYIAEGAGLPHPKAGTILFLLPHYNPIHALEKLARRSEGEPPLFGQALKQRMRAFFHQTRTIELETFAEFLPNPGCAVTLDPQVEDKHGLPVARIAMSVHPASLAASDFLAGQARAVLDEAGAVESGIEHGDRAYLFLQAGTARMGKDPSRSVLDPTGQAHDVGNLYVADGSGFPSAGAAPFTLTIMANALRVAAHIIARGKQGTL